MRRQDCITTVSAITTRTQANYISQDPIGLAGGNPTLYRYVFDSNREIDPFGLDLHHIIPQQIYKEFKIQLKEVSGYIQNVSKRAKDVSNLINLKRPFHGNHPAYNDFVRSKVSELVKNGDLNLNNIRSLQNDLKNHIEKALKSGKSLNDYFKDGDHLKKTSPKKHH